MSETSREGQLTDAQRRLIENAKTSRTEAAVSRFFTDLAKASTGVLIPFEEAEADARSKKGST